jgi:hypothetical protein
VTTRGLVVAVEFVSIVLLGTLVLGGSAVALIQDPTTAAAIIEQHGMEGLVILALWYKIGNVEDKLSGVEDRIREVAEAAERNTEARKERQRDNEDI